MVRALLVLVASISLHQAVFAHTFGDSLIIVYSGGLRGRAEGCGCSSGPQGGLDRRTTLLKQNLGDAPYFALDCGGILDLDPEGGMIRSRCTISGLARENLKAIAVSSRDLFYGTKFLSEVAKQTGVKLLSFNIARPNDASKSYYDQWMVIETGGKVVAVTGLTMPLQPRGGVATESWITLSPDSVFGLINNSRPANADITILLTDLDEATLRRFLQKTALFDFAFTSSSQVFSATPFEIGKCFVQHPENNGRSFEVVIIPPDGKASGARFLRLPIARTTPVDSETAAWLKECLGK